MCRCGFVYLIMLCSVLLSPLASAQRDTERNESQNSEVHPSLQARIRAQIVPPFTETPNVAVYFVLLNGSEGPLDVEAGSWRIIIDGKEIENAESRMLFGNGPRPPGGFRILGPGEKYEFSMSLPIVRYFLPNGQHTILWKGSKFLSNKVTVTITPESH